MAIQQFDQLNNLSKKWYSKMEVPQRAKERRVKLSMQFAEIMSLFFEMIIAKEILEDEQTRWLAERLNIVASNHIGQDNLAYINDWSWKEAKSIVDITAKHIDDEPLFKNMLALDGGTTTVDKVFHFEEFDIDIPQSEYWTSDLRCLTLGIECASCIENYYEMYDAFNRGNNRKVWKSQADNRVRPTHTEADGQDIPITDLFVVGNSQLLFPGDVAHGAEPKEIDGCRCFCVYYKR